MKIRLNGLSLGMSVGLLLTACSGSDPAASESDGALLEQPVVGGTEATPGAWPSMVAITKSGGKWCGGTLIRPDRVLTAAHCFSNTTTSLYQVIAGRHDLTTSDGVVVNVTAITKHPSYDPATSDNDIAILTLASNVSAPLTRLVAPARMAEVPLTSSMTMLGWGALSQGGPSSNTLQQVSLGHLGVGSVCEDLSDYGPPHDVTSLSVTENQICIGRLDGGQDTCQGDSGGPALVFRDGEWFQIGITSFGEGCALADLPGVYTYLPNYFEWELANAPGGRPSWLPSAQIMNVLL